MTSWQGAGLGAPWLAPSPKRHAGCVPLQISPEVVKAAAYAQVLEQLPRASGSAVEKFLSTLRKGSTDKRQRDAIRDFLRTAGAAPHRPPSWLLAMPRHRCMGAAAAVVRSATHAEDCVQVMRSAIRSHAPCATAVWQGAQRAGTEGHVAALSDTKSVVPITNLGSRKQRASTDGDANGSFIVPAGLFTTS